MSIIINPQDGMFIPTKNIGEMLLEHFGKTAQLGIHLRDKDGHAILIPCEQLHSIELTGPALAHINAHICVLAEHLEKELDDAETIEDDE